MAHEVKVRQPLATLDLAIVELALGEPPLDLRVKGRIPVPYMTIGGRINAATGYYLWHHRRSKSHLGTATRIAGDLRHWVSFLVNERNLPPFIDDRDPILMATEDGFAAFYRRSQYPEGTSPRGRVLSDPTSRTAPAVGTLAVPSLAVARWGGHASAMTAFASTSARFPKHPVDELLPPGKLAVYGFQHVLAFYAGAVIVPILLAAQLKLTTPQLIHLINADLFTCGIASILQSVGFWKVGVRLPLLQGVTFTAVSPMIAIGLAAGGGTDGLVVIYGAVIVAGLVTFAIAPFFSRLVRFFPPVVTGSVILVIGIALLPVAAGDVVGGGAAPDPGSGKNLAYALGTLLLIVAIQRVFRGFLSTVAVLVGLVAGTLVAWGFGDAGFQAVGQSPWLGVTTPFFFGWPRFSLAAIISMIVVMLITAVETTGDVFATGEIVEKRVGRKDIAAALRADGLATTIGGVFNSFPYTAFAENVGLVRLTRVKSRYVVATAGLFMIVIGLLPKAGAVVASIPPPVLGGAALAMFATVAVVGVQTLTRVDFHDQRNVVIVGTSVGLAMLVTVQPGVAKAVPQWAEIILGSGITLGSITAILLNLVFHHIGRDRADTLVGRPGDGAVRLDQVNGMSRPEFLATFGRLFQGATWVAERAYAQRPFAEVHNLRVAFQEALFGADKEEQRALMARYPDLGAESVALGEAGAESVRDQSAAGLTRLGEEEHAELGRLAAAYRDRFGIPLIVCVRDAGTADGILRAGWARMDNSPAQEHGAALIEIAKIANHRFEDLVAGARPAPSVRDRRAAPLAR